MQLRSVGEIVRVLRGRRHLEQLELARACGWRDASAVSRIETDRISPTRRTLLRLAENLADEATTGSVDEVRAWLFNAAGILPTKEDVERISDLLPAIEAWNQPALVIDFAWYVWRANTAYTRWLGFPPDYEGKNLLQLLFGDAVRAHLDGLWERAVSETVMLFRMDTEHRRDQRWYRTLLDTLSGDPDFARIWEQTAHTEPSGSMDGRAPASISILRLTLTAEPRLSLAQCLPDDQQTTQLLADAVAARRPLAVEYDIR